MNTKSLFLVCFDIVSDKVRYRAVKVQLKYGTRVQKSVFECHLDDRQYLDLKKELERLIDHNQDSVRYYQLCKNCAPNVQISGLGIFTRDEELIII